MKKVLVLTVAIVAMMTMMSSCNEADSNDPVIPKNTTPGDFTPPTTNYWKLDGATNQQSADAGHANVLGNNFGLSKPFGSEYNQMNITFCDTVNIRKRIPEGGYKEFFIVKGTKTPERGNDSVLFQITSPRNGGYTYFYGTGDKLFISKENNKLRYSTKATINLIGSTNTNINLFNQTGTTEFSWEEL